MTVIGVFQIGLYFLLLLLLTKPLGLYMARVFEGRRTPLSFALRSLERSSIGWRTSARITNSAGPSMRARSWPSASSASSLFTFFRDCRAGCRSTRWASAPAARPPTLPR
jgi:hypothetical protein